MTKLPVLSGKELISALKKGGFRVVRQRGTHVSLQKGTSRTVAPLHDELARGTLIIINIGGASRPALFDSGITRRDASPIEFVLDSGEINCFFRANREGINGVDCS